MEKPRRAVVVTGFGPFGEHAVNASWIAVQELEKLGLRDDVDLHVYEVPVEYQTVQRLIPALWKKHSPQLVVHVGVSGSQCCVEGGPECIDSIIDMDTVCKRVSALGLDVTVTISKDAGRYGMPGIDGENRLLLQCTFPSCSTHEAHMIRSFSLLIGLAMPFIFHCSTKYQGKTRDLYVSLSSI
ncbi:pyroglutamyl-peptidase 1 isoform X3 [Grus americana]|uniref:pyroglutamyl-peptidase 1 isoform X3 n=1 Tax=Grus americana TaxID=9117 RepID=UPI0024086F08|nr:pyroglutamyl-peptidase 1 isoform X3 [Grus americana]